MIEIYTHTPWYIPQPHQVPFDLSKSVDEIYAETEEYCRDHAGFMTADERKAVMTKMIAESAGEGGCSQSPQVKPKQSFKKPRLRPQTDFP